MYDWRRRIMTFCKEEMSCLLLLYNFLDVNSEGGPALFSLHPFSLLWLDIHWYRANRNFQSKHIVRRFIPRNILKIIISIKCRPSIKSLLPDIYILCTNNKMLSTIYSWERSLVNIKMKQVLGHWYATKFINIKCFCNSKPLIGDYLAKLIVAI